MRPAVLKRIKVIRSRVPLHLHAKTKAVILDIILAHFFIVYGKPLQKLVVFVLKGAHSLARAAEGND